MSQFSIKNTILAAVSMAAMMMVLSVSAATLGGGSPFRFLGEGHWGMAQPLWGFGSETDRVGFGYFDRLDANNILVDEVEILSGVQNGPLVVEGASPSQITGDGSSSYLGGRLGLGTQNPQGDLDVRGDIFLASADVLIDADGGVTSGTGTASTTEGTALIELSLSDHICADTDLFPTYIYQDSDGDCCTDTGTQTYLIGEIGDGMDCSAGDEPDYDIDLWSYVDTDGDIAFDVGEELFYDYAPVGSFNAFSTSFVGGHIALNVEDPLFHLSVGVDDFNGLGLHSHDVDYAQPFYWMRSMVPIFGNLDFTGGVFTDAYTGGLSLMGITDKDYAGLTLMSFVGSDTPTDPGLSIQVAKTQTIEGDKFPVAFGDNEKVFTVGSLDFLNEEKTYMTLTGAGRLGVNTSSPIAQLHVHDEVDIADENPILLRLETTTSAATPAAGIGSSFEFAAETTSGQYTIASLGGTFTDVTSTGYDGDFFIATTSDGGSPVEKMRVTSTGRVGIGTTNPAALLDVQGGVLPARLTFSPCGVGYPEGVLFYNTTDDVMCFCDGTGASLKVSDNASCF